MRYYLHLFFLLILLVSLNISPVYADTAKEHFEKGLTYIDNGKYDDAIEEFLTAIDLDKNSYYTGYSYYNIGLCYENKQFYVKAIDNYKEAIKYSNGDELGKTHFRLGYCLLSKGDYKPAIDEFLNAIKLYPSNNSYSYYNIGLCYQKLKDYKNAIEYYEKSINYTTDKNDLADTYFYLGYCYSNINNPKASIENYIKSNEYSPYDNTYYNLGIEYDNIKRFDLAVNAYKEYLKLSPQGEYSDYCKKRIAVIEKTDNNDVPSSDKPDDLIKQAYEYYQDGAYEDAISLLNKVLSTTPNAKYAHLYLAYCYHDQGLYDKAQKEYQKEIDINPSEYCSYYYLAQLYINTEDYKKAIDWLNQAAQYAKSDKNKADVYFWLGYCYLDTDQYDKSIEAFKKVLKIHPDDSISHYNLGQAYYYSGDTKEALKYYKKYITLDPSGDYVDFSKEKIALIESGNTNVSTGNLTAKDHYLLGEKYYDEKKYDKAREEFLQAIEIDPDYADAHNSLGALYFNIEKDYSRAAYHFLSALELKPNDALIIYNVGLIYDKQNRYKEALEKFKAYLQIEPNGKDKDYVMKIIKELENKLAINNPTPIPSPTVSVASKQAPVIEVIEPASLIGQKNLVIQETNPQVTTIRVVGIVSDDEEVKKLTVNGQPIELSIPSAKGLEVISSNASYKYQFSANVGLTSGENIIKVQAWDASNNMGEAKVAINYKPDQGIANKDNTTGAVQKGDKWAVVIGIGKFQNPGINKLNYTVSDAEAIYKFLTTKGGFDKDHVKLLINEDATTKNIKSALGVFLARKAMKNDLVFIYYSGHGAPEADPSSTDGDGMSKYIVSYDADPEELYATAFPMEEIRTIFQKIEAGRIAMFIDSCYSGATGGRTFSKPGMKSGQVSDKFLDELAGEGRVVITASGTNEVSLETPDLGHGIFTYYLLEGLGGKADTNGDKRITIDELYEYISNNVIKTSKNYNVPQHPVKKGETTGQFIVVTY